MTYRYQLNARPRQRSKGLLALIALFGVALLGFGLYTAVRIGAPPQLQVELDRPGLGQATGIRVFASEPKRGLFNIEVSLRQGDQEWTLGAKSYRPQPAYAPWAEKTESDTLSLTAGKITLPQLQEGSAELVVKARPAGTWLRSPDPVIFQKTLEVRLHPPSLDLLSQDVFPTQGGSEAVVYRVGKHAVKTGVEVGEWFFEGYPVPGGMPEERFALFAVPFDVSDPAAVKLVAEDAIGNRQAIPFLARITPKPPPKDTIELHDSSMARIVKKIRARHPEMKDEGSLLANYVAINRHMRAANNQTIKDVGTKTEPKMMWNQAFVQMPAKVVSNFADRRTYVYQGRPVDQADHLGYDLASVARGPIPAANTGVVVYAEDLGIYGNAVIIDHGYGLMSLYAHCSSLDVKVGDKVTRGQIIGRTGTTGMAFGDHLHFSTLLAGLPVNPIEWWDPAWIQNRIAAKLPTVLKFQR